MKITDIKLGDRIYANPYADKNPYRIRISCDVVKTLCNGIQVKDVFHGKIFSLKWGEFSK